MRWEVFSTRMFDRAISSPLAESADWFPDVKVSTRVRLIPASDQSPRDRQCAYGTWRVKRSETSPGNDGESLHPREIAVARRDGHIVRDCDGGNLQVVVTQRRSGLLERETKRSVHLCCGGVEGNDRELRNELRYEGLSSGAVSRWALLRPVVELRQSDGRKCDEVVRVATQNLV